MAIFTAGCIESTGDSKKLRTSVYELAKHDLDSPSMKISVRKSPTCINYIAFLPKDKIIEENILEQVSNCDKRTVIIFELDYKYVGIVCEYKRIIDYILDKPKEFADERSYDTIFVDNIDGVKLVSFNLDNINREAKAGFVSLGFTILLTTSIFFSGYAYMGETKVNMGNQKSLEAQYKMIVEREFKKSDKIVKKVDIVKSLEKIEELTQKTFATLNQVQYESDKLCVEVQSDRLESFLLTLPKNITLKQKDLEKGIVQYCYAKI